MENLLKIWNSSVSGKLYMGMELARFVASSKGTNLLKDGNNYLYFHLLVDSKVLQEGGTLREECWP